jgi:hypothetical protein
VAKLALCIGINDYPGTGSDLAGCVNDATDWKQALLARGFEVDTLLDREATGKGMRRALREIVERAAAGDTVVVQYSGHGSFVPDTSGDESDGTDECLCPYDIASKGPITDDELFEIFSAKAAGVRLVMISDSCHSGTVARFNPIVTPPTAAGPHPPRRTVRFLAPQAFLPSKQLARLGLGRGRRAASAPGRHAALLLSGCQDVEYSYDAWFEGRANGAFTFVALRELSTLKKSATYQDWFARIRKVLPSQQYPQQPNLSGTSTMKKWAVLG